MLSQLVPMVLFGIATAFSPGPNNIMTSIQLLILVSEKAIPTMLGVIIGLDTLNYFTSTWICLNISKISIHSNYHKNFRINLSFIYGIQTVFRKSKLKIKN